MRTRQSRPGAVTVGVLLLLPVLFLVVVLAIYATELVRVRSAMQVNADAAALAGAAALIDDARLLGDSFAMPILLQKARDAAAASARENIVGGKGIDLRPPGADDKEGEADLEFGRRASPADPFVPVRAAHGASAVATINAIQVTSRRTAKHGDPMMLLRGPFLSRVPTDIDARATALIERDIIGIRPQPGIRAPLVPIALLSDPDGDDKRSWEYNTAKGQDEWAVSRKGPRPTPVGGSDGLREMTAVIGGKQANAVLLALSPGSEDALARQLREGVSGQELEGHGGELVPDDKEGLAVPLHPGAVGEGFAEALLAAKGQGDARIFPLYRKSGDGSAVLSGFVAARIMEARQEEDGPLVLVLQPAMRSTPSAVTGSSRGRKASASPYIARVRLAD